jgi:hypothetical protein
LPGYENDQGIETLPALFDHSFPASMQPPVQGQGASSEDTKSNFSAEYVVDEKVINGLGVLRTQVT